MQAKTLLEQLGFTEYEARAYLALVRHGPANGYELAKSSGIPRANVYRVLERLAERGAARRIDTSEGTRYAALPATQLMRQLDADHRRTLTAAQKALESVSPAADATPVFNVRGYLELLGQARVLADGAKESLLLAIQPAEAAVLAAPLRAAHQRAISITTLCMESCATECGNCQGSIHRHCLAPGQGARWLMVITDAKQLLAGEIRGDDASAVLTEQPLIVELAASYIRQSLALATVATEVGDRFEGLLSHEAIRILDSLHPEGGFLAYLKKISAEKALQ